MWIPSILLLVLLSYGDAASRKRVCVIGAGMAGIAALKQLSDQIDEFEPIVFEKNSEVGGLWIYTDNTGLDKHGLPEHSRAWKSMRPCKSVEQSVANIFRGKAFVDKSLHSHVVESFDISQFYTYKICECYLPKEIMTYPDYQEFHGRENRSIVSHGMISEYIRNCTDHFSLRQYIQFDTLVENVSPIKGDGDWTTTKWRVKTRNLNTNQKSQTTCDAMMICNGHYFKPNIPKILGIESFPGTVIHSSAYRRPELFANQTVVVLGARQSGTGISRDLSDHAKSIYLSHRHDKLPHEFPSNIQQVKGVVAVDGNRLILQDNSSVTADSFIYCTGYSYDVPFLDESSGIHVEKDNVGPLHKLIVNVDHPTMGFIGLPTLVVNGLLHTVQSKYFLALLQGKVQLPDNLNTKSSDISPYSLKLGTAQWKYQDELALEANFEKLPLFYERGRILYENLVTHFGNATSFDFRIMSDNDFVAVRRRDGKTGTRWQDFID